MKKILLWLMAAFACYSTNAQCPNGDAEMNSFTNWQGYTGVRPMMSSVFDPTGYAPGIVPGRHTIVTTGNDPIVGAALPMVTEGNYAIRLGNTGTMREAEVLSYTFTVPAGFSFRYAMVLQDPQNHVTGNKPFFSYWVSRSSAIATSLTPGNYIDGRVFMSDATSSFFHAMSYNGEALAYKEWQTECVPALSSMVGQTVTIYFATGDCSENSHFGYAYIDGLCKPSPPVPQLTGPALTCSNLDPLFFDGSGSQNESEHYWIVTECDASGNPIGNPTAVLPTAAPAGQLNVRSLIPFANGLHYYKVTLGIKNCSSGWVYTSRIFQANIPDLRAGNKIVCCGAGTVLTAGIGKTSLFSYPAGSFKWYNEAGTFIGNGTMVDRGFAGFPNWVNEILVSSNRSTKYRVVFDNGCRNEQWAYVTVITGKPAGGFSCVGYNNCTGSGNIKFEPEVILCGNANEIQEYDKHLQLAREAYTFSWSNGVTSNINNVTGNTTYTLTVNNGCTSSTYTITPGKFRGAFPGLSYPPGMTLTQPLVVYNTGMPAGNAPAYNAHTYELRVWDRWGNEVYEKYITTCTGFYNGEIKWDGRDKQGNYVNLNSVYHYEVILRNCDGSRTYTGMQVTFVN
ncbi:hypothetical protein ECE50_010385 [Chitinophaga sp. Mgbs1]|uniref:Uncharacterized protein n=1 Tax=Chitinophaga solisilvae TaxID=1233460 RepID=A0A3S1B452_9BACT|nr:hypothetical protein [Chitinophaga solisilvae]